MSRACLVDMTKCMGCRGCQVACKQWNSLPAVRTEFFAGYGGYQNPPNLTADTYTLLGYNEIGDGNNLKWVFAKRQCMHCLEPACHSACPVAAFSVDEATGAVSYDSSRCMGCRYCMMACPFGIPTFEWGKTIPYIKKCTFCEDRQAGDAPGAELNNGPMSPESQQSFSASFKTPACAKTCPTGAIKYGDRDALIADAKSRIQASPGKYIDHIYGEHEAGGTNWMYISSVPFTEVGFPATEKVGTRPYAEYTAAALGSVPIMVIAGGAVLGGLYWLYQRKLENSREEV
jgi:formate dehydrogenase iron-sulfur subunit